MAKVYEGHRTAPITLNFAKRKRANETTVCNTHSAVLDVVVIFELPRHPIKERQKGLYLYHRI